MFSVLKKFFVGMVVMVGMFGVGGVPMVSRAADLSAQYKVINSTKGDTSVQGIIFAGICEQSVADQSGADTCTCRATGNCSLGDALQVFVNISTFILGISGTAVFFVFVYGGFKWIFSRGDSHWVDEGKAAMTGGVIGLMIIFGSYVALNFIIAGLTTPTDATIPTTPLETTVNHGLTDGSGTDGVFTTQ